MADFRLQKSREMLDPVFFRSVVANPLLLLLSQDLLVNYQNMTHPLVANQTMTWKISGKIYLQKAYQQWLYLYLKLGTRSNYKSSWRKWVSLSLWMWFKLHS